MHKHLIIVIFIFTLLPFKGQSQAQDEFIVVLDPGHGGKDPGTLGTGRYKITEKDIVLDVALQAGKLIQEKMSNVKVVFTRNKDEFIELKERTNIANKAKAHLFISVHIDGVPRNKEHIKGASTYVMGLDKTAANMEVAKRENNVILLEKNYKESYAGFDPENPESLISFSLMQSVNMGHSIELAKIAQGHLEETAERRNIGVKQGPFYVICYTAMPSILMELGYLTNKEEEDFLHTKKAKETMATVIFKTVNDYKRKFYDKRVNVSDTKTVAPVSASADSSQNNKKTPSSVVQATPKSSETSRKAIYRVQLFSSSSKLNAKNHPSLKKFKNVFEFKESGMYKYCTGNFQYFKDAKKEVQNAYSKGFKDAFVISFENEKRISISEAQKINGEI